MAEDRKKIIILINGKNKKSMNLKEKSRDPNSGSLNVTARERNESSQFKRKSRGAAGAEKARVKEGGKTCIYVNLAYTYYLNCIKRKVLVSDNNMKRNNIITNMHDIIPAK